MNIGLRKPRMSRDEFFVWAEAQDTPYEFDGFEPVAMTRGTLRHNLIIKNILRAVDARLRDGCQSLGPEAGVRTIGDAVRYPDAVVTCSKIDYAAREVPNPIVVFEVLSATSHHNDRIVKLLEYRAVPSIRRYIIVEHDSAALTLHARSEPGADWTTTALTADKFLPLPEIHIEIPVAELFVNTDLASDADLQRS
jgi:Uma2 family endonuclease